MNSINDSALVSAPAGRNSDATYPFAQVTLPDAETASAISTINSLLTQLPNLPALTPLDRKRMSKLGLKSRGFVDLAIEAARKDQGVLPRSIELQTLLDQDQFLKNLSLIETHLSDMTTKVEDSLMLVGNWLYGISRSIYSTMQTPAARTLMPEQQKALKQRFARSTKKKTQQATVA